MPVHSSSCVLTLQVADTHSIQQHYVFMGHLSHHAGSFKEGLSTERHDSIHSTVQKLTEDLESLVLVSALSVGRGHRIGGWNSHKIRSERMNSICERVSHQGDVPVSRTKHLQDHLDLLEGWVTCIFVFLALHPQCARVNIGSCAQAEVLLLVNKVFYYIKYLYPESKLWPL